MAAVRRAAGLLVAGLLLGACSGENGADVRGRLPSTLTRLVLSEGSEEITAVVFPHAGHARGGEGRPDSCTHCHHTLADDPESLPSPCVTCHPMEPEEGKPPDL